MSSTSEVLSPSKNRLSRPEFIALMAMLFATIAFSIDAMLPALPEIAAQLSPEAPNQAQLILTSFVLGMGIGTFFTGPLADTFGRKIVILGGMALYIVSAFVAWTTQSLEVLLAARVVQGMGAAGPRVAALAIVRDLYAGRGMAKIMSFVMVIFTLVPAVAPAIGAAVMAVTGWRGIFLAFILFSVIASLWLGIRQSETLKPEFRRPFRIAKIMEALREIFGNRTVVLSISVLTICFGILFSLISTIQPVFDVTFGRGESFPFWFMLIAIVAGSASFLNAMIVERFGMRKIVAVTLGAQAIFAGVILVLAAITPLPEVLYFAAYVLWGISIFSLAGLTIGNLNALAMEPLGHIAGIAASAIGAISTVLSVVIAVPIGLLFDGTPVSVSLGTMIAAAIGFVLTRKIERPSD